MTGTTMEIGKELENFLLDIKRYLPLLEAEASQISELKSKLDLENQKCLIEKNRKLERENEHLKKLNNDLELIRSKEREEQKRSDRNDIENLFKENENEINMYKADNNKLKEDMNVLRAEKNSLDNKCNQQDTRLKELETSEKQNEQNRLTMESRYQALQEKLENTEKELQETKLRLSKQMGLQLADSNPNIADLSDATRPTKLAEMFDSLYDDEYTNAFEELDVEYNNNRETCEVLLQLLLDAREFCDKQAKEQLKEMRRKLLGIDELKTDILKEKSSGKELKDMRKKHAKNLMSNVYEKFRNHMADKGSTVFLKKHSYQKTIEYANRCVEVCWLMAVQDPPVVFGRLPQKHKKFDTNAYRPYTSSGFETDYAVWPALYLHVNGPILCKGVVQPISDRNRTVSEDRGEAKSAPTNTCSSDDHFLKKPSDRHDVTEISPNIYHHSAKYTHGTYSNWDKASDVTTSARRNRNTELLHEMDYDRARSRTRELSTLQPTDFHIRDELNEVSLGTQAYRRPLYNQIGSKFNYEQTTHKTHYTSTYAEHRDPEYYATRGNFDRNLYRSYRAPWKY